MNAPQPPVASSPKVGDYYLLSIEQTPAPRDSVGDDWHVYRIGQGKNVITGYRRGTAALVTAEVEQIIGGLNERRMVKRGRVNLTSPRSLTDRAPPLDDNGG